MDKYYKLYKLYYRAKWSSIHILALIMFFNMYDISDVLEQAHANQSTLTDVEFWLFPLEIALKVSFATIKISNWIDLGFSFIDFKFIKINIPIINVEIGILLKFISLGWSIAFLSSRLKALKKAWNSQIIKNFKYYIGVSLTLFILLFMIFDVTITFLDLIFFG